MEADIIQITKKYGRKEVLRGASFRTQSGRCIGILGTNGCGKSTLLKILAGVLTPDGGQFLRQGEDLLKNSSLRARIVGYVPQGTALIEELSARDNLRLWYEPEAMERSLDEGVLRRLGIHEFLRTAANKLSGGMRKRLTIGCAMAKDPEILLLDEPTAALDLVCKEQILDTFDAFRRDGGALVMVSHDQWELAMCDSWLHLRDGVLQPYVYDGQLRHLIAELVES